MIDTFENEQAVDSRGLRDFLMVLFKYKVLILGIFLVTAGFVTLSAYLMPVDYVARSSILVKIGREYMNNPEVGENRNMLAVNLADMVNAEVQILTNRSLAERVVTKIGVEKLYPGLDSGSIVSAREKAVDRFLKNLQVEAIRNSSVIQVSFHHGDPRTAIAAVNALVEFYKEKHLEVFSTPRSLFLDQQLATYSRQLKDAESNFENFKQKSGVFALEEQRSLLLQQRANLDGALKDAQNRVDELARRSTTLARQQQQVISDRSLSSPMEQDRVLVEAQAKLLALQLDEQELLKKFKPASRMVTDIRKEIELVQKYLKQQKDEIDRASNAGNVVVQQVRLDLLKTDAELNAQRARVATLRGQLGQVGGKIVAIDGHARKFQDLKREAALSEKNYQIYLDKAEEARLSEDMNQQKLVNLSVIQPASVPSGTGLSKRLLIVLFGYLAGAALGIGSAFLREKLSQGVATPERAEKYLGLPVLASIAYIEPR